MRDVPFPSRSAARLLTAALAATVTVLLAGTPALAHNELDRAVPGPDSTLAVAPQRVVLEFTEPLIVAETEITVTGADGSPVPTGDPEVRDGRAVVPFPAPLANGEYTVSYQVLSLDGHQVRGSYTFTVAAPVPEPTPTPPPADPTTGPPVVPAPATGPIAPVAPEETGAGRGPLVALVVVGLLLVAGGGALWWSRRRRASA